MTTTPPEADTAHDGSGPRVTRDEVRDLARLRRSLADRKVAGVAGGLARHLDVDPLVLRVAFVVLTFFGGAGLILYGACWLLVPEEGSDRAAVTLDDRSRGVALIIVGALAAISLVGGAWGNHAWFPLPLVAIALVVWLLMSRRDKHDPAPTYSTYATHPGPPAAEAPEATTPTAEEQVAPATTPPATTPPTTTPPTTTWSYPPPPRDPRRRGPILFWITLALIALAVGVLGMIDLAGADVAGSAYPATALAVTAVILLVGSVYGRAGGLILLGFLSAFATLGATIADDLEGEHIDADPTSAAQVSGAYRIDAGEIVVDLSRVRDLEALSGKTIDLRASVGHLQVILPRNGLDVELNTDIDGAGGYHLFTHDGGGFDEHLSDSYDGGQGVPSVTINTRLDFGAVDVEVK